MVDSGADSAGVTAVRSVPVISCGPSKGNRGPNSTPLEAISSRARDQTGSAHASRTRWLRWVSLHLLGQSRDIAKRLPQLGGGRAQWYLRHIGIARFLFEKEATELPADADRLRRRAPATASRQVRRSGRSPLIITRRMSVSFARMRASYGSATVPSITQQIRTLASLNPARLLVPFQNARCVARRHRPQHHGRRTRRSGPAGCRATPPSARRADSCCRWVTSRCPDRS